MNPEQIPAETNHDEMLRILATDFGVDPEQIRGWTIIIALEEGDTMRPAVRTSLGAGTTVYTLLTAACEMQYMSLANNRHPDHRDICDDDNHE